MVQYAFMHLQNIEYFSTGENFNFALETESLYFIFLIADGCFQKFYRKIVRDTFLHEWYNEK